MPQHRVRAIAVAGLTALLVALAMTIPACGEPVETTVAAAPTSSATASTGTVTTSCIE